MIESNWLSRTTGGLVIAVPLIAFAAPPVPDHSHQLQDSIAAGNCVDGPSATTCVSFSTATGYDRFSGTLFNSYFDLSESRYLVGGGFTVRFISCSVLLTTLSVDKNGATLAETPLDPSSPECFTSGYSFINGVFDDSYGGFQSVLHVSAALSSPQIQESGNQVVTRVDNSTGARTVGKCIIGVGENMLQGGFSINGEFFPSDGGVNSTGNASYAKCVYMNNY